jgi:hypothetical protein
MAWAQIPKTGPHAPCNPPNCFHKDCADQIRILRSDCTVCGEPIRYQKYCYYKGDLAHFVCAMKDADDRF